MYSGITIGLVVIVGIVFYTLFANNTEQLYYQYLEEKARVVATERFEKDEMDAKRYSNVVAQRQNAIPTSKELFINLANRHKADRELLKYLTAPQLGQLYYKKQVNFRNGDEVGTCLIYNDNEGTFAVLVLSRNPYGEEISGQMGWLILAMMILAAIVLWLISKLYAVRMVDRIDKDYQTEKMFVNNASHEINNPLTAIQGECDIALMKERTPEEYRNTLQRISMETERVIRIMHQLLQFSHTRAEVDDPSELDKIDMVDFMQQFQNEETLLRVESDFFVYAREDLLNIAFRNLVNNARKYSDDKPIEITIGKKIITLQDHGIGIPEEDLQHIFEPFYRASNAMSRKGHGIGLALAKQILEKYSARVRVESQFNSGTKFTIKF